jgi:hypothetical protein
VEEEIPLDLGPRHFQAAAAAAPPAGAEADAGAAAAAAVAALAAALPPGLRRGDRLRLSLPEGGAKPERRALLKRLAAAGVEVEVVAPPAPAAAPRIAAAEDLGPVELFQRYAALRGMPPGAAARGAELLRALPGGGGAMAGAAAAAAAGGAGGAVSLSFHAVEVEGYFSFKEATRYSLADRGLVVVTGRVEGGPGGAGAGAESNGAGKTALVMAPLWALTGAVDARSEVRRRRRSRRSRLP